MTWECSFSRACLRGGVAGAGERGFLGHHGSNLLRVLCYQRPNRKGLRLAGARPSSFRRKISLTGPAPVNVLVSVLIFPIGC